MTLAIAVLAIILGVVIIWAAIVLYRMETRLQDVEARAEDLQRQLTAATKILTDMNAQPAAVPAEPIGPTISGRARQRRNERAG